MNRFEGWLNRIYKPYPEQRKRKVLFWLSSFIVCAVVAGGFSQYIYNYAGPEIWWLFGLFGVLGFGGLYASIFGSDFWVALILGRM